jgi:hypothetical protein
MRPRFVVLALLVATPLRAQTGSARDVMARGERAYRDLEFDVAATTLRRVLAPPLAAELDDSARARALTYLGAADHYRGQPDSAIAVFRRLVEFAPDAQPDTLVFPPEVTELYHAVRSSMTVVAARPRRDTVPARTPPVARDTLPAPTHAPPPPPPPPPPVATAPVQARRPAQTEPGAPATSVTVTVAGLITNVRTGGIAATAAGFESSVQFRRVALAVRYAEGGRDLVEGSVALRYTPTSWFSLQAGPHARHYDPLSGPERVVTWRLGGRGDFALVGSSVSGHAMLWRALALAVNLPPGSGRGSASGGEFGVTLDLGPRPVWFALAYGIDQAQVKGASWRANVNTLTLTAGLRRR